MVIAVITPCSDNISIWCRSSGHLFYTLLKSWSCSYTMPKYWSSYTLPKYCSYSNMMPKCWSSFYTLLKSWSSSYTMLKSWSFMKIIFFITRIHLANIGCIEVITPCSDNIQIWCRSDDHLFISCCIVDPLPIQCRSVHHIILCRNIDHISIWRICVDPLIRCPSFD